MTGVQDVFAELDTNIHGTVRFEDGSVVEIEGIGTIVFVYKTGEHRSLSSVYLIPKLTTNITSLGQLDELGYDIQIGGRGGGVTWLRVSSRCCWPRCSARQISCMCSVCR
jgi:hypothetical protein